VTGPGPARAGDLLRRVLPAVSRSFALSLRILPAPLRAPIGVTYLVARAADTLADTAALPPAERRAHLDALRAAIGSPDRAAARGARLADLARRVAPDIAPGERALLARLPEVLAAHHALPPDDRDRAARVLAILTAAMADTLARFPAETEGRLGALDTLDDLDRYTYGNAGCVGEFWTDALVARRPSCRGWDLDLMRARGARFGQGLQLVNVLRDLPRDLLIGRCFLPRVELTALGLRPEDLRAPSVQPRLQPLLDRLVAEARLRLDDGLGYTLAVPRREWRLRLASVWPLLIGRSTLDRLARAERLLDPTVVIKVPRREVRAILIRSLVAVGSDRRLAALAGHPTLPGSS
jgi:farnesyl-diphosphate farnesyltransferase